MNDKLCNPDAVPNGFKYILLDLYKNQKNQFNDFFNSRKNLSESGLNICDCLNLFEDINLIEKKNNEIFSKFNLYYFSGCFFFTDGSDYFGEDRVWYLLEDESLYFAKKINPYPGDSVLDIGTGSGILSIISKKMGAEKVVAIDINKRALDVARLNAYINDVKDIEFRQGSCYEPVRDNEKFDLILCDPPFVPVPKDCNYVLSGAGGEDGLFLPGLILNDIDRYLKPKGGIQIISMSPGQEDFSELEKIFYKTFKGRSVSIKVEDLYGSPRSIDVAIEPFKEKDAAWASKIKSKYSHMHYLFIEVYPSKYFEFKKFFLKNQFEITHESGDWDAMYNVIENSKKHSVCMLPGWY